MPDLSPAAPVDSDHTETIEQARKRIEVLAQYVDTEPTVFDLEALADLADSLLAERVERCPSCDHGVLESEWCPKCPGGGA
jgi:hypothetical protein